MRPPYPNRASLTTLESPLSYANHYLITPNAFGRVEKHNGNTSIAKSTLKTRAPNLRHNIVVRPRLSHRNISTFHDLISSNNQFTPLSEIVRKCEIDPSHIRSYFRQLLDVLDFCHRQGVHHRNLHPDVNLFVDSEHSLKVTGFGANSITHSAYSAPEVIDGAGDSGGDKIDSWACGIILHLLVNRSMPDPVRLHDGDFEFSQEANGLIAKLLTLDPSNRCSISDASQHEWLVEAEQENKITNYRVDFKKLINDALPERTDAVVEIFASKLARLDIEHRDDLKLLASLFKSPNRLALWLEEKSRLPAFASLRLARYMFSLKC